MNSSTQHKLVRQFLEFFQQHHISPGGKFLLAVSGGIDSVTLCELSQQAGLNFAIAHCNFGLRGEESERDEAFVKGLGVKYKTEVITRKFDTRSNAEQNGLSIQETARNLRYQWFDEIRTQRGFSHILIAHHADDNMETMLMHFFRGTGLQGLTGMPEINRFILRPMLGMRRAEIMEFAKDFQLGWVEDSSNAGSVYTRNYFRNELLPAIARVFPNVDDNLLNNMERFSHINRFYQTAVDKMKQQVCEKKGNELRIPVRKLKKLDYRVLLFEIIREFGFGEKQLDDVISLMEATPGKYISNGQFQIIKHGLWLIIAPVSSTAALIPVEKVDREISYDNGSLKISLLDKNAFQLQKDPLVAQLDADQVEFPLVLRKWKQGDYFYPLGMRKKKKLARFFIDEKLPKNRKEDAWVLESNKKIIWVVGMRIDDRYKITPSTTNVLLLAQKNKPV